MVPPGAADAGWAALFAGAVCFLRRPPVLRWPIAAPAAIRDVYMTLSRLPCAAKRGGQSRGGRAAEKQAGKTSAEQVIAEQERREHNRTELSRTKSRLFERIKKKQKLFARISKIDTSQKPFSIPLPFYEGLMGAN